MLDETPADGDASNTTISRRRFLAGSTAAAAAGTTLPGAANAVMSLNFDSGLVPDPRIEGSVTIAEHKPEYGPLEYIDDNGERATLADVGAVVAPRDQADQPHNPITLEARNLAHDEYTAFPRNLKYDSDGDGDVDDDDKPVEWHDPTHWTKDASGSAGSGSMTAADGDALTVSATGQGAGDTITWTLDLSTVGSTDATITSGMSRQLLQQVVDVNTLASGVTVEFALQDSTGSEVVATYDPDGDASTTKVMLDSTATSAVRQVPIGDLEDDQGVTLDDIQLVVMRIKDADADFTLHALNAERASRWEFGTQEYLNADSEVDTQAVEEPTGSFSITSLESIAAPLADATITDLTVDVELQASELPGDATEFEFVEATNYSLPHRFRTVYNFEPPTAYDLTWTLDKLVGTVLFPAGRYVEVGHVTGQSEHVTLDDVANDDVSLTDATGSYRDAAIDADLTLTSSLSAGSVAGVYVDVAVTDDQKSIMTASSGGGGVGPMGSDAGGVLADLRGYIYAFVAAIAGAFAWWRA